MTAYVTVHTKAKTPNELRTSLVARLEARVSSESLHLQFKKRNHETHKAIALQKAVVDTLQAELDFLKDLVIE